MLLLLFPFRVRCCYSLSLCLLCCVRTYFCLFCCCKNWPHNYCIQTCNDDIYFQFDFPLCILVFISCVLLLLRFIYCFECIKRCGRKMRVHIFVLCVTLIERTAHNYDCNENSAYKYIYTLNLRVSNHQRKLKMNAFRVEGKSNITATTNTIIASKIV